MKVLHIDSNHPILINQLNDLSFTNDEDYTSSKEEIKAKIHLYDGFIIRSRFSIDKNFIFIFFILAENFFHFFRDFFP